ncbi:MAG: hypothetical protein R3B65_01170 [Candidatus Paceibacterota bacterium]
METLSSALTFSFVLLTSSIFSQNVGINETGSLPDLSAILHVESDDKGVLIPGITTAQRNAIVNPAQGLAIYNTTTGCFDYFSGSSWQSLCGTSSSIEKPRMIGYGGGVGSASRIVPANSFHDIDVRVIYDQQEVFVELTNANLQYRLITNDWADSRYPRSVVVLNNYLYLMIVSQNLTPQQWRVYRYDINNIAAGGTQMNFLGLPLLDTDNMIVMTSNSSEVFYFTYDAGNSANDFRVAKYSLIGTNFTYIESIDFGSSPNSMDRIMVDNANNVYGVKTPAGDDVVTKFDPAGNLIYVTPPYVMAGNQTSPKVLNWDNTFYFGSLAVDFILNRVYLE